MVQQLNPKHTLTRGCFFLYPTNFLQYLLYIKVNLKCNFTFFTLAFQNVPKRLIQNVNYILNFFWNVNEVMWEIYGVQEERWEPYGVRKNLASLLIWGFKCRKILCLLLYENLMQEPFFLTRVSPYTFLHLCFKSLLCIIIKWWHNSHIDMPHCLLI